LPRLRLVAAGGRYRGGQGQTSRAGRPSAPPRLRPSLLVLSKTGQRSSGEQGGRAGEGGAATELEREGRSREEAAPVWAPAMAVAEEDWKEIGFRLERS
jgi:hypothetical protein